MSTDTEIIWESVTISASVAAGILGWKFGKIVDMHMVALFFTARGAQD